MVINARQGSHEEGDYRSYLLRLWRAGDQGEAAWRASLRSAQTGKSIGFASLEDLFDYLRGETDPPPSSPRA